MFTRTTRSLFLRTFDGDGAGAAGGGSDPGFPANTPVKDMTADEKLEYTLARADDAQKSCSEGHLMVGDNVSKAYARRGALRCRDCVNAESRANKAKNRGA